MATETVTSGDFEIESNHESADAIRLALADPETPPVSESDEPSTETESPAAGTETGEAPKVEPPPVDKRTREGRKSSIQREIDDLTHQKRTTLREVNEFQAKRDQLQAELRELEAKRTPAAPKVEQPAYTGDDPNDPPPNEADPIWQEKGWQALVDARADWSARKTFRKMQQAAVEQGRQSARQNAIQSVATKFAKRLTDQNKSANEPDETFYARVNPKLLELRTALDLEPHERPTGATAVADVLAQDENPRAIMEHFTQHPTDLQRISTLHPSLALVEMGKLVERLTAASSGPASVVVTSAVKAPIKPVGGSPIVNDDDGRDVDDTSEAAILNHFHRENRKEGRALPASARR